MRRIIVVLATLLLLVTLIGTGCAAPAPAPAAKPAPAPAPAPAAKPSPAPAPAAKPAPAPVPAAAVKPIELSLNSQFTSISEQHKYLLQWGEKIKADSGGKLTVRVYPGATITSAADAYPGVAKGVSAIATGFKYAYDKELGQVLPAFLIGVPDANIASRIYDDIWNDFAEFKVEWPEVKVLWLSSGGPNFIHTARKPVRTLEDLKGLQLRVSGRLQSQNVAALGGTPVDLALADLVSALQKGTVNGAIGTNDQLTSHKLADVASYTTSFAPYCSFACFVAINQEKFNSLSPELQKVIDNSVGWGRENSMKAWAKGNEDGEIYAKTKNHTFITLAPDEQQKWLSILWAKQEKVAAELDAKGFAGTKLLRFVQERVKKYTNK